MRPLAASAVSTAEGPGSTVTGTPASSAAATSRAPGSEIAGRPESLTSAIRSPACSRGKSWPVRSASLCRWYESSRALMPCRSRSLRVCRVSSQRTRSASASSRRTRSVTSSRLPIGVAQTERGTLGLRFERLEAEHPRADHTRVGAELRLDDPDRVAGGRQPLLRDDLAGRAEQQLARGSEAASDDHELRLEHVHEGRDAGAEPAPDVRERPDRFLLTRPPALDQIARVRARTEDVPRNPVGGRSRGVRLEVAVPATEALDPVAADDDVA